MIVNYNATFVRSSLEGFEEYEIPSNKKTLTFEEYLYAIYPSLKKLIDKKQESTNKEQKI